NTQKKIDTAVVKPEINLGKLPLYFTCNKGQVDREALFYSRASRYTLWLTKEGLIFDTFKKHKNKNHHMEPDRSPWKYERDSSRLRFIGANKQPEVTAMEETPLRVSYFKGDDKSKWTDDIPTSKAVLYKRLYDKIDLKVYGIAKQIEYDWIVHAGGNPEDIRFSYTQVAGTRIDENGNLLIATTFGELMHKAPVSFQLIDGRKKSVASEFKKIGENTYGVDVGVYDKTKELIIDPVVLPYSTFLGGDRDDDARGIAVDGNGYIYVTGCTASTDFPTQNQYQTDPGAVNTDVFVSKLDISQSGAAQLLYSTYLGGNGHDFGNSICVDNSGNAYITGFTESTTYPLINQYQGSSDGGITDAIVTKLNTNDSGVSSLLYSTILGGSGGWSYDYGEDIAVDSNGYVYITGYTVSTNYPTLNQYQSEPGDLEWDVILSKLDTTQSGASSLLYSTYLGGSLRDHGTSIAVDENQHAYITGYTTSTNFPLQNPYQAANTGQEAFVARVDTTATGAASLVYSTYLGAESYDVGKGIAIVSNGVVCVCGYTYSTGFPVLNQFESDNLDYLADVFVSKLDTKENGATALLYSTYLCGSNADEATDIAVDSSGIVYITGITASTDFTTKNEYMQDPADGNPDALAAKIDTNETGEDSLIYSTYLGGAGTDEGKAVALDGLGGIYVAGRTESAGFPTANPYQADQPLFDAFVTRLSFTDSNAITGVSPDSGPESGGTTVVVSGTDLGDGTDISSVTLCGIAATILSQTADGVTVLSGAGTAGTGDVVVTSTYRGVTTLVNGFTYNAAGTVVSVAPSFSPVAGGTTVVVSGTNLGDGTDISSVTLCGIAATILSQTADGVTV
ncbi:MAG: hypothetical protein GY765_16945, partial [bacterium]|nr:hypothetical protein [bacterium]